MLNKFCICCNEIKDITEFKKRKSVRSFYCRECSKNYSKKQRNDILVNIVLDIIKTKDFE